MPKDIDLGPEKNALGTAGPMRFTWAAAVERLGDSGLKGIFSTAPLWG